MSLDFPEPQLEQHGGMSPSSSVSPRLPRLWQLGGGHPEPGLPQLEWLAGGHPEPRLPEAPAEALSPGWTSSWVDTPKPGLPLLQLEGAQAHSSWRSFRVRKPRARCPELRQKLVREGGEKPRAQAAPAVG